MRTHELRLERESLRDLGDDDEAASALDPFPLPKSCGGPVMAHNTNTKIFLKRAGRGRKKAVLQHSPFMPYGDCEFSITAAGVVDAVDG